MNPKKVLIFDFDGLVIDTEGAEVSAWRKEFSKYGMEFDLQAYIATIGSNGPEVRYQANLLAKRPGETRTADQIWNEHIAQSIEEGKKLAPLPGVLKVLDQAEAMGVLLAIGSSSEIHWVSTLASGLGIFERFNTVVTFDQVEQAKPAPDIFLKVLEKLDVAPENALVLEDSLNGVLAANRAGIRAVAVPTAITRHLDFSLAEEVLPSLEQLDLRKYFS